MAGFLDKFPGFCGFVSPAANGLLVNWVPRPGSRSGFIDMAPSASFSYPVNTGLLSTDATTFTQAGGLTVAQNFTAPNSEPGYTFTNDATNNFHDVPTGSGTARAKFGCAVQAGTQTWMAINQNGIGSWAIFDLTNKSVNSVGGGSPPTATVTDLGNGYIWCEVVFPTTVVNVKVAVSDTLAHIQSYVAGSATVPGVGNAKFYHFAAYS